MGFWNDLSRFAGNLTGGFIGESDEEKRRKRQQQQAAARPVPTTAPFKRPAAQQQAAPGRSPAQQQRITNTFNQVNQQRRMSPGAFQAQQGTRARINNGLRVEADTIDQEIDEERKKIVERSFNEGKSFEDISDRTGLGVEEVRRYADKTRPDYGKKPLTLKTGLEAAGKFGVDMLDAAADIIQKPVATIATQGKDTQNAYDAAKAAHARGEITTQKLFEITGMLTKDVIGKKVVRDKAGMPQVVDKSPVEFGQEFTDAGYNAVSVLPIATGAKAAMAAGKILPTAVREGAVWGTIDTMNDAVQGRASLEQAAMNYGLNAGLAGGGAAAGKVAKAALEAQRGPNSERGAIGPMIDPNQDARERFAKGRDLGDKQAPVREVSPEVLLQRATNAGVNPKTAKAMMEEFGRNKFAIMLDETGDLRGAKSPAAVAKAALKKIPDAQQIGGVATKNDLMPTEVETQALPEPEAPTVDPLANLREGEKPPTASMKADKQELSINNLEQVIDDASWGTDKEFIKPGTDNADRRLNQVVERRLNVMKTANQDKLIIVMDEHDIVHHVDPRTGEEIAAHHRDDLAGKVEAFAATTKHIQGKDLVEAEMAQQGVTPETAPEAPRQAKQTKEVKVPTSVKEITKSKPKRADLEGHRRYAEEVELFTNNLIETKVMPILKKAGYTFEEMYATIDDAARRAEAGATDIEIPTPILKAYQTLRKEMDKAYQYRQGRKLDGRKQDGFGDKGELYLPRSTGGMSNTSMLDQLEDASVLKRRRGTDEHAIQPEQMDMSPAAISRYMVEMLADPDHKRMVKLIDDAAQQGRTMTPNQAIKAIDRENAFLENVAATAKNGKIRTQKHAQDLAEIGKAKGKDVHTVEGGVSRAPWLEAFRQFRTLKIDEHRTLDDLMSKPYNAAAYAREAISRDADIIEDIRTTFPDLAPEHVNALSKKWDNAMARFTDADGDITEYQTALAERLYKRAAVQDIVDYLETHKFTDKYTNDLINYQVGPLLVQGRVDQNFAQKLSRAYTSMTDRALRGWNLKSATVELTEMQKLPSVFGIPEFTQGVYDMKSPGAIADMIQKYGKQSSVGTAREFFETNPTLIEQISQAMGSSSPAKVLKAIVDPHAMIHGVTMYRNAVSLRTIELHYQNKGLEGRELTDMVLKKFKEVALPSESDTHISIQRNAASRALFQYWQWNVRNTAEDARLATGLEDAGHLSQGMGSRSRFIGMTIANKTAIWMAYAGTGTSAAYAFNLFDPFGILEDQWTGIQDEEKTVTDNVVQGASFSPLMSLVGSAYFAYRQEEERVQTVSEGDDWAVLDKSKEFKNDNVLKNANATTPFGNLIPGTGQAKKTVGMYDVQKKGFYEGPDGRIRYQGAKPGTFDEALGYVFGKGATKAGQEYNDTANPFFKGFLNNGVEGFIKEARKDAFIGTLFGSTKERQRPLSTSSFDKGFNEQAKEAFKAASDKHGMNSEEARTVMKDWIKLGRDYNKVMDDFRKKNPAGYNRWQATFDDNLVSPEKWSIYKGNPEVFEFSKARKLLEQKHLGRVIDPIYNLPDERAKQILQHRSLHTGDDMKNAQMLYKTDWYEQFQADMDTYGKQFEGKGDLKKTARAKEWDTLSKSLYEVKNAPEFNLVKQLQDISDQYGYNSEEGKQFFRDNYDAWKAQKDAYDQKRFETVNRMRQIEGVAALTWEQFSAKIEFESDSEGAQSKGTKSDKGYYDKDGNWQRYNKYSKGGGSSGSSDDVTRTGVADTITSFGNQSAGMTDVKAKKIAVKDPGKAVKKMRRASGQSPIRIKI